MLNYSDKQSFPPKVIQICMKNNVECRHILGLWRHTAQIKYIKKTNYNGSLRIVGYSV